MLIRCSVQCVYAQDEDEVERLKDLGIKTKNETKSFWRSSVIDITNAVRICPFFNKENASEEQKESDGCVVVEFETTDYILNVPYDIFEFYFNYKNLSDVVFEWDGKEELLYRNDATGIYKEFDKLEKLEKQSKGEERGL